MQKGLDEVGGTAPSFVLRLCEALPDHSLTVALASGGTEFYGWGLDRHIQTDLFDAITDNTRVTIGAAGGKMPKEVQWPRPKPKAEKTEKKPVSVAQIFEQLSRR